MAEKKHKVKAVMNDTKGGKSAMSAMNPQSVDSMKPLFENLKNHHSGVKEQR